MHLQFFLPFSLKIPKFSALRAICFPFSWFFSKCSLNLSIYHNTFVCMGAKIILCLKLLENMTYIRGHQTFLSTGSAKSWTRLTLEVSGISYLQQFKTVVHALFIQISWFPHKHCDQFSWFSEILFKRRNFLSNVTIYVYKYRSHETSSA